MRFVSVNSPYKEDKAELPPIVSKMPMYDFSSAHAMEQELMREEMCIARIPNNDDLGYTNHVAFVYKDEDDKVYSAPLMQHHGTLKPTKENANAIQEQSPDGAHAEERTSDLREVSSGEQSSRNESSESTGESGETYYSEHIVGRDYPEDNQPKAATTFRNRKHS